MKRPRVPIEVIGELRADLAALRKAGHRIRKLSYTVKRNTGFDRKEYPYVAYLVHPVSGRRQFGAPNRSFAVKRDARQPRPRLPNPGASNPEERAGRSPLEPEPAAEERSCGGAVDADTTLPVPVPAPSAQATPLGGLDTVTGA